MHSKIVFQLAQDVDGYPPVAFEGVWAIDQGDNRYVIDNIPFFTREAALADVVEVANQGGELVYAWTLAHSDNSLIRVVYYEGTDPMMLRKELEGMGCSTELDDHHHLIAVNIPPEVKLSDVQKFLQDGFDQDQWDYEEAIMRQ